MAKNDTALPPECDREIFERGKTILAIDGGSQDTEKWVRALAEKANARVDWHYSGGIANVLHLGDEESWKRVEQAITELEPLLRGEILRHYKPDEDGLYRAGVTPISPDAIAVDTVSSVFSGKDSD